MRATYYGFMAACTLSLLRLIAKYVRNYIYD